MAPALSRGASFARWNLILEWPSRPAMYSNAWHRWIAATRQGVEAKGSYFCRRELGKILSACLAINPYLYETTSRFSAYKGLAPFVRLRCCSPSEPTLPPFLPHIVLSTGNGERRRCYATLRIIRNKRIISSSNRFERRERGRLEDRLIKWLLVRRGTASFFFLKKNRIRRVVSNSWRIIQIREREIRRCLLI